MMPLRDLERIAAILCFNNPLDIASVALLVNTYKKRNVQYSDADLESFRKKLLAARAEIAEKFAEYIIDVDKQSIEATAKELAKIARNG